MLADTIIREIADDRIHGSTELALLALEGITQVVQAATTTDVAEFQQQILMLVGTLQGGRPLLT